MLGDISKVENIYIACGYRPAAGDRWSGTAGAAAVHLDPFSCSLFVFCGRRRDRIKVLLYKRVEDGAYQWLRDRQEMQKLS